MLTYFTTATAAAKLRSGALATRMDALAAWLWERGYSQLTAYPHLRVIAEFSRWLDRRGIAVGDIEESHAMRFLRLRHRRRLHRGDWASLRLLLKHLREIGIVSVPVADAIDDECVELLHAFTAYLRREKGLSSAAEKNYGREIHSFIRHRFGKGPVTPSVLARITTRCSRSIR